MFLEGFPIRHVPDAHNSPTIYELEKRKADLQGKVNGVLGLGQDVRAAANST